MLKEDEMKYVEKFEDDRFVYELSVERSKENNPHLFTFSQGPGFYCRWTIHGKDYNQEARIAVTDDNCELIIFDSVESAVKGAKAFLSM
jgi:hypothetical protein